MKTKFLIGIAIAAIMASFAFISCNKEDVVKHGSSVTPSPMAVPKCCSHQHKEYIDLSEDQDGSGPFLIRHTPCCDCKHVNNGSGAIMGDTIEMSDMVQGVYVEYIAQDETIPYTFTTNEWGHWDYDNSVSPGEYNIRFSKTGYVTQTVYDVEVESNGDHTVVVGMEEQ